MRKTTFFITKGLLLLTVITSAFADGDFFWQKPGYDFYNRKCEWRYEGCVIVDENAIDTRSYTKRLLDDLYSCKNTELGCNAQEQKVIDEMEAQKETLSNQRITGGMTPSQFSKLLKKYDPKLKQKGYFIPLGLNDKELLMLAASTSLGLVLFPSDEATMDFVQDHKSEFTERIVKPTNENHKMILGGAALGSYFMGVVIKDNKLVKAGLYVVTSQIATQIVTEGFKRGFGRSRPNADLGSSAWRTGGKSFFSGHSSGAWSFATVFAEIYKDNKVIPYLAYGVAALTSYGRLHDRKHFLSDVFYGAVAGHVITKMIMRIHEKDDSEGGLMVFPSWDASTGTFMMNFEWQKRRKKHRGKFLCADMPDGPEKIEACIYEAFLRSQ
jgi:hypothetical protein